MAHTSETVEALSSAALRVCPIAIFIAFACADEFWLKNTGTLHLGRRICDELFEKLNNSRTIIMKIRLFQVELFRS